MLRYRSLRVSVMFIMQIRRAGAYTAAGNVLFPLPGGQQFIAHRGFAFRVISSAAAAS